MSFFNQAGQSVGHQVNVGRDRDYVGVDAEYMAWLDRLHGVVERLTKTLPAEWRGWEPTNEQMDFLDVLKDMIAEWREASA